MQKTVREKENRTESASVETHPPAGETGLTSFDYRSRTRLVFGVNMVERVGELARELDAKKILLVTDPGIVAAGHAERVQRSF